MEVALLRIIPVRCRIPRSQSSLDALGIHHGDNHVFGIFRDGQYPGFAQKTRCYLLFKYRKLGILLTLLSCQTKLCGQGARNVGWANQANAQQNFTDTRPRLFGLE